MGDNALIKEKALETLQIEAEAVLKLKERVDAEFVSRGVSRRPRHGDGG